MTIAQRSIRLSGRIAPGLDRLTGESGELYYDTTAGTLRLYNGRVLGGELIATRAYVSSELIPYALSTALIGLATETYVNTAVSNLVDSAPGALNTLNELAAAINDDANYAATITTALGLKAPLASPSLTGTPLAPTASPGTNTTQLATTAFVRTEITNLIDAAPSALDTLNELAAAIGDDANYAATITTALGTKAPAINPTFTGTVTLVGAPPTTITNFSFQYFDEFGSYGWYTALRDAGGTLGLVEGQTVTLNFDSGSPITVTLTNVVYVDITGELLVSWGSTAPPYGSALVSIQTTSQPVLVGVTKAMVGLGNVTNESKATMFTDPTFTGTTTIQQTTDVVVKLSAATGVVAHDYSQTAVWYHTGVLANFTANFTNIPATDMRGISVTLIIAQGATPYIPNAVQIGGVAQTINWQNNAVPPGQANKKDMVNFLLIRINDIWTVTGSLASYG